MAGTGMSTGMPAGTDMNAAPMMSVGEAARALGARVLSVAAGGENTPFRAVSTDSRSIGAGELFVALRGERFDGHDFVAAVAGRGAAAAVVDEQGAAALADPPLPLVVVADTRKGLGQLAAHWRGRFDIPLVAVTGSNGKTTVKEMIAAILRAHYGAAHTLATAGNFNNDIGLPLTLLRLRPGHHAAVIEIGMNHPGETRELAAIARPGVGLINNAQREHQEFMASVEEVAREHGSLIEQLAPGGTAVVNADDGHADYWRGLARARKVGVRDFGVEHAAAVTGSYRFRDFGSDIALHTPEGETNFTLGAAGLHNVCNAVAAAAAATAAGATLEAVSAGLAAFAPVKGRLQKKASRNGATVIDDTYNANPDSVRAAIDVLAQSPAPRVLVLGEMGEVGDAGPAFHTEIGAHAASQKISTLLATGGLCRHAVAAFEKKSGAGMARHFENFDDLLAAVRTHDRPGTAFLVKGSRYTRMERVVNALVGDEN